MLTFFLSDNLCQNKLVAIYCTPDMVWVNAFTCKNNYKNILFRKKQIKNYLRRGGQRARAKTGQSVRHVQKRKSCFENLFMWKDLLICRVMISPGD